MGSVNLHLSILWILENKVFFPRKFHPCSPLYWDMVDIEHCVNCRWVTSSTVSNPGSPVTFQVLAAGSLDWSWSPTVFIVEETSGYTLSWLLLLAPPHHANLHFLSKCSLSSFYRDAQKTLLQSKVLSLPNCSVVVYANVVLAQKRPCLMLVSGPLIRPYWLGHSEGPQN